ncbi:unnamed protein product [Pleuronectes platessa]|uniref:Uncharacterized protein n=1 Tax=Pleuronectes platessa TaxID=8262 RepID=A0A9N7UVD4_PLEPL|nr:unnamed protein product [Pleuronectes platessa]
MAKCPEPSLVTRLADKGRTWGIGPSLFAQRMVQSPSGPCRPDMYLAFGGLPSMQRTAMQSDQSAERRNTKTKEGSMLKMRERGDVLIAMELSILRTMGKRVDVVRSHRYFVLHFAPLPVEASNERRMNSWFQCGHTFYRRTPLTPSRVEIPAIPTYD